MPTFLETSKKFIDEKDVQRRERLVMRLDGISVHQLPALEEWIKTGDKEAIRNVQRAEILNRLYVTDPLTYNNLKHLEFVREFIKLMHTYLPEDEVWENPKLKDLINPHSDTPLHSRLSEQREKERQYREASTKGSYTD